MEHPVRQVVPLKNIKTQATHGPFSPVCKTLRGQVGRLVASLSLSLCIICIMYIYMFTVEESKHKSQVVTYIKLFKTTQQQNKSAPFWSFSHMLFSFPPDPHIHHPRCVLKRRSVTFLHLEVPWPRFGSQVYHRGNFFRIKLILSSWESKGTPPLCQTFPGKKALLWSFKGRVVNNPLIGP